MLTCDVFETLKRIAMKEKITICFTIFSTWCSFTFAQNVGINTTGAAPAASAMLDVEATNRGFLTPRMTSAQRTAIAAPANGLMVYDTNLNCHFIYSSGVWKSLCDVEMFYGESTDLYNAGVVSLRTVNATVGAGDRVLIEAEFDYAKGSLTSYVALCLLRNGVQIHEIAKYSVANADNSIKMTWIDIPAAGTHTYEIRYYMGNGTMSYIYGHNLVCLVQHP